MDCRDVALGQSFAIIFEISNRNVIIISAIVAVLYTARGGMAAVAITDVLQLILLIVGLIVTFPYFMGEMDFIALWSAERSSFSSDLNQILTLNSTSVSWWDSFYY